MQKKSRNNKPEINDEAPKENDQSNEPVIEPTRDPRSVGSSIVRRNEPDDQD